MAAGKGDKMGLIKGHSKEVVSENIKRSMKAGSPQRQAIAMALSSARKYKKMAEGGMAEPDTSKETLGHKIGYPGMAEGGEVGGGMDPSDKDDDMMSGNDSTMSDGDSTNPEVKRFSDGEMAAPDYDEDATSDFSQDAVRGLNELRIEGAFQENENASPKEENDEQMLARALYRKSESDEIKRYAMGGFVEGETDGVLGAKPDEDMSSPSEEPMSEEDGFVAEAGHAPMGLSEAQRKAIDEKKRSRRYF